MPTLSPVGVQQYCEALIAFRTGRDGFEVTEWSVDRIGDHASRSITYIEWTNDHGTDELRADCIVHDDKDEPPSVMIRDQATGEFMNLEVETR